MQKQPITGPQLHFGLGEQTRTDVVRVVWPNGTMRAEFDVKADQDVLTEQRLKASCPFLFAFNGKQMEFIKDAVPWGSAIGLRINTLGSADIATTGEWYKIGRDQLVPHDGYYDLRITAELVGSLLLRLHRADGRGSSCRNRDLRRRAFRDSAGEAWLHHGRDSAPDSARDR